MTHSIIFIALTDYYDLYFTPEILFHFWPLRLGCSGPSLSAELLDLKGAIHVHSKYSHDSKGEPENIARSAKKAGLSFVMVTDHPSSVEPAKILSDSAEDDVLFFPGVETKGFLALNVSEQLRSDEPQELIDEILHQPGGEGLAFLSHIEDKKDSAIFSSVGWLGKKAVGIGANDCHENVQFKTGEFHSDKQWAVVKTNLPFGKKLEVKTLVLPEFTLPSIDVPASPIDTYERCFKFVNTHVLAESKAKESILSALKQGHAYVAHEFFKEASGFQFYASNGETSKVHIMGDELRLDPASRLELHVLLPSEAQIDLFQNGKIVQTAKSVPITTRSIIFSG